MVDDDIMGIAPDAQVIVVTRSKPKLVNDDIGGLLRGAAWRTNNLDGLSGNCDTR